MRPGSIILFERLFLASIALTALDAILSFDNSVARMERDTAMAALGWGAGALAITAVIYVLALLALGYFIARRASNSAKWVLTLIVLLGLTALPRAFAVQSGAELAIVAAANLLALAAVACLFLPDTRKWLGSQPHERDGA